jgi:hypothetical protein
VSQTRRLAAILAADVAGYSRLMGADEEAALISFAPVQICPENLSVFKVYLIIPFANVRNHPL